MRPWLPSSRFLCGLYSRATMALCFLIIRAAILLAMLLVIFLVDKSSSFFLVRSRTLFVYPLQTLVGLSAVYSAPSATSLVTLNLICDRFQRVVDTVTSVPCFPPGRLMIELSPLVKSCGRRCRTQTSNTRVGPFAAEPFPTIFRMTLFQDARERAVFVLPHLVDTEDVHFRPPRLHKLLIALAPYSTYAFHPACLSHAEHIWTSFLGPPPSGGGVNCSTCPW